MYGIIKKLFTKKQTSKKPIINNEYNILLSYNKNKREITLTIDYESILDQEKSNIDQDSESLADFLYKICNNKSLLASLVIDSLTQYKILATEKAIQEKKSDSLIFANSILSNIESILSSKTLSVNNNKNEPIVKPIRVFHNGH